MSAFSVSETAITRAQWAAVTGLPDPSRTQYSTGTGDPVQRTNWYAALVFCSRLSLREGLTPVYIIGVSPKAMGGCRGVLLADRIPHHGFALTTREYHQQLLLPLEVTVARRRKDDHGEA